MQLLLASAKHGRNKKCAHCAFMVKVLWADQTMCPYQSQPHTQWRAAPSLSSPHWQSRPHTVEFLHSSAWCFIMCLFLMWHAAWKVWERRGRLAAWIRRGSGPHPNAVFQPEKPFILSSVIWWSMWINCWAWAPWLSWIYHTRILLKRSICETRIEK